MDDEGEEVDLREGMPVATEEGADLGKLAALLVAEEEDEAEFLLVEHNGAEILAKFPKIRSQAEPTDAEMELAYQVYDENAAYAMDDEDEA